MVDVLTWWFSLLLLAVTTQS